jgi:hypothetical protein
MRFNLEEEYIEASDQVHRLAQTLKERDAEIERLKLEAQNEKEYAADMITTYRCEAEDLKALLARAADALEPLNEIYPQQKRTSLIAELRKAAE